MKEISAGVLALDTSNYTTSVAIIDQDTQIVLDVREILKVKQGERGLRQSHALFQHMQNLPVLLEKAFMTVPGSVIAAIAVSDRPRPAEGSYMPVFYAGVSCGKTMAAALGVPVFRFSHQEGHIAAGSYGNERSENNTFLAFHLSGGTTELLFVENDSLKKLGGTRDLSFGQVIDRIGVLSGLGFPAGKILDKLSLAEEGCFSFLKPVHFDGLDINLSGLETQARRWFEKNQSNIGALGKELFHVISEALIQWTEKAIEETGCRKVLFTGGVASSESIRRSISRYFHGTEYQIFFGQSSLSSDNAVGVGLLGVKKLWR